jgi:hypothetical protein
MGMSSSALESSFAGVFAAFLSAAAKADAHWYSVKCLSEGVQSLPDLLGIADSKLNELLSSSDFGRLQKDGGFVFFPDKFKTFLAASGLEAYCEHTQFRIRGFSKSQHFIRIGSKNMASMSKPGVIGLGPRIRNCRELQTNFKNSFISKPTKVVEGAASQCRPNSSASTTTAESVPAPTATELTLLRMKTNLLPLLLLNKESLNLDSFWKPVGDSNAIVAVILDIAKDLQQQKDNKLSEILGTIRAPVSPQSKLNPNKYPTLKQLGVSLEDRRVHQSLLSELYHLGKKHDHTTTLYCNVGDNKLSSLVFIPSSKDFGRMKVNENNSKWFAHVLTALGGLGNENATLVDLLTHIGRKEDYGDAWKEAVALNGHTFIPRLDAVATFAVQSSCNMNQTQMKQLRRCLRAELGSTVFSTETNITQTLGLEYVEPQTGVYKKIPWSYKSTAEVVRLCVATLFKSAGFRCDRIDLTISIDHGKGYSRATLNVIPRWQLDDGSWCEDSHVFTLANARCKKDNTDIIRNTFGTLLNTELKQIHEWGMLCIDEGLVGWGGQQGDDQTIPVEIFMAGDILFYAIALGKEGYATWWCNYCQLFKTNWQATDHQLGIPWTMESLKQHASNIECGSIDLNNVQERGGVKEQPLFDAIEIDHYVPPVLHLTIGKGNDVLENLTKELQAAGEAYSNDYYKIEKDVLLALSSLEKAKLELQQFNDGYKDYEMDLRRQKRQRRGGITDEMRALVEEELDDIALERVDVQDAVDLAKVDVSKTKTLFAEEKKKDENCKGTGQPLHAEIDSILKRHGIDRAAQFGGALAGNGCRTLMADADSIINEIQEYVFQLPVQQRVVGTLDQIEAVCERHRQLLLCLDGYFSGLRTKRFHLTAEITSKTIEFRDRSLAIMRHLSMSVTPKDHCIEDHAVQWMIVHEGIGDLGEDQGEHNHQLESKEDLRLGNVRCFRRREVFKSKQDGKKHGPGVKQKITEIYEKHAKRKTMEQTASRHTEKRQKRIDAREEALLCPNPEGLMLTMRRLRQQDMTRN